MLLRAVEHQIRGVIMANISDEKLVAFVDGELSQTERAEIEAAVDSDDTIARRVAVFARSREQVARQYDEPLRRPVPDHLIDLVLRGTPNTDGGSLGAQKNTRHRHVSTNPLNMIFPKYWFSSLSLAALSVILCLGVVAGWQAARLMPYEGDSNQQLLALRQGQILVHEKLKHALESVASGQKVSSVDTAAERLTIRPLLTFRTKDNRVCRQYEVINKPGGGFAGVACRNARDRWQIVLHSVAQLRDEPSSKYSKPAADGEPSVIDLFVDQLIDGDALGKDDEDALLTRWKSSK